jgi:hypothetical protein
MDVSTAALPFLIGSVMLVLAIVRGWELFKGLVSA